MFRPETIAGPLPLTPELRLTKYAKRAGCAAKLPADHLFSFLKDLPGVTDPNVLVGTATADDAAIYKVSDELALVFTTDFFTAIVDGCYDFGAIAAANALSDVYAMGGTPMTALSIVAFPDHLFQREVLKEILRGAFDKAAEAGVAIVGGHTIRSEELIFGLAVVGKVAPDRALTNAKAQPGDVLILTKPLGVGIISTAAKNDNDSQGAIGAAIVAMKTLNRVACEEVVRVGAHALTDITGFGLLGHLRNIVEASNVGARVYADRIPVLKWAKEYVQADIAPGGTHANHRYVADCVTYKDISKEDQLLLCDAQTSGGLLAAVPADRAKALLSSLHARGLTESAAVGEIESENRRRIFVERHGMLADLSI